ncbi:MAG: class I SAM-dependent methyltransferase [Candidatus Gottesmanbacteria bacterium]
MNRENNEPIKLSEQDPFGLKKCDFKHRTPEKSEMFSKEEALTYIEGCDFPESADDFLLALEIKERFGTVEHLHILDAMCGPGRLGRDLISIGSQHVSFHDGDETMLNHAMKKASKNLSKEKRIASILSPVEHIPVPDDTFDLVVCHNSTHQLNSVEKLQQVMEEFLRVTVPGGFVFIADYQRSESNEFLGSLENRLNFTKPSIVPLLIPSWQAAFSKQEFDHVLLNIMPSTRNWLVFDAALPALTSELQTRVNQDPVKGHVLDYSPISLRVIAQKGEI